MTYDEWVLVLLVFQVVIALLQLITTVSKD